MKILSLLITFCKELIFDSNEEHTSHKNNPESLFSLLYSAIFLLNEQYVQYRLLLLSKNVLSSWNVS